MHEELPDLLTLLNFVRQTPGSTHKALCRFGTVSPELAQRVQQVIGLDTEAFAFTLDSYGMRHALNGHGHERGSPDVFPLFEADLLALPGWLPAPPVVLASHPPKNPLQPRRIRFERPELFSPLKTVVILEVRTGRRQFALVTLYKTKTD